MKRNMMLAGGLINFLLILPGTVINLNADLIIVGNSEGQSGQGLSGLTMNLQHQVGGSLGGDAADHYWFIQGEPPFSSTNWLRVYSDQNNQYYGLTGYEQCTDNRPYSGSDANQPFPLVLDTQGPDSINSVSNHVWFRLYSGIDEGRELYQWNMNLFNGATFSDGSTYQSGVWDLAQDSTYNLPYYNLSDVQGIYGTLNVTPIPEPFTLSLLGVGAGLAVLGYRLRRNG